MGKTISSCMWEVCSVTRKWSLVVQNDNVLTKSYPIVVASRNSFESSVVKLFITDRSDFQWEPPHQIKQVLVVATCATHRRNMFVYIFDEFERNLMSYWIILHCCTSQFKSVIRLEGDAPRAEGQNSLTP